MKANPILSWATLFVIWVAMMRMGIIQGTMTQSYIFVSGRLFVVGFHLWPVGGSVGQVIISETLVGKR